VYIPASGTNTSQVNFGFAIAGDDGTAYVAPGLQFVQIEDTSGNAIPTPTTTFFPIPNTSDLDGQSLTSDAAHGATVDGSNDVYFFSGIPQHTFTLSSTPIDVSNYGGDGDSIASLPGGDQAVVSGNGTQLAVISGILANAPVIADAINNGDNMTYDRDGLVSSGDGKVLLSRGSSGLDVFAVTPVAAHAGSTGTGTTSFSFNLVTTFSTSAATNPISSPVGEDGRDGMAISPTDSSRAVVVGYGGGGPIVQLLTGLTGASPTLSSLPLRLPAVQHREVPAGFQRPEPSAHRRPFALTPTGVTYPYGVSISPNGTTAYIATDAGIVTVSGVNTGTLTQVGSVYAPTVTAAGGTSCAISNSQRGYSLGILPDGKYLVVDYPCYLQPTGTTNTTQSYGVLLTIPIGTGGVLGAPVGQLNQVVVPTNDQLLVH
jgi:hypothetical protein